MQLEPYRALTDVLAARAEFGDVTVTPEEAAAAIRCALRRRSGVEWVVATGDDWLCVTSPPERRTAEFVDAGERLEDGTVLFELVDAGGAHPRNAMGLADRALLAELVGAELGHDGWVVPEEFLVEAVARAEGRVPSR